MTIGQAIDCLNELDLDKYMFSGVEIIDMMEAIADDLGADVFSYMGQDEFAYYLRQRGYRVVEDVRYYVSG